eukprot:TRINITY_DN7031_c0_g1_i1.p1 TRINITY_DN7031_c0_g1~~TRINITY_DN7031_c0_g1_i1.p1  ORF type:complete len:327 (+),score=70.14 TRINITY_DN7031_c0_g1_i1:118-981(+)
MDFFTNKIDTLKLMDETFDEAKFTFSINNNNMAKLSEAKFFFSRFQELFYTNAHTLVYQTEPTFSSGLNSYSFKIRLLLESKDSEEAILISPIFYIFFSDEKRIIKIHMIIDYDIYKNLNTLMAKYHKANKEQVDNHQIEDITYSKYFLLGDSLGISRLFSAESKLTINGIEFDVPLYSQQFWIDHFDKYNYMHFLQVSQHDRKNTDVLNLMAEVLIIEKENKQTIYDNFVIYYILSKRFKGRFHEINIFFDNPYLLNKLNLDEKKSRASQSDILRRMTPNDGDVMI